MTFLLMYWRWFLLGAFVVLCAATVGITKYQLANARAELAEYKSAYTILSKAAQDSSDSITRLEVASKDASKRAAAAVAQAKKQSDGLKHQGAIIANLTAPKDIGDCDATRDLVNSAIPGRL